MYHSDNTARKPSLCQLCLDIACPNHCWNDSLLNNIILLNKVASGVSNIIDHILTKQPIINRFYFDPVSPVKLFANTIETDNLENFLCTLYRDRF